MKRGPLVAILILASGLSHAGDQSGTIQYVRARASDGMTYFALSGSAKSGSPTCATKGYWMIRDENSNDGKQQYAMLLAAQLAGRTIAVSGLNTCTRWADGEDVEDIRIVN